MLSESPNARLNRLMCGFPWTLSRGMIPMGPAFDEWTCEGLGSGPQRFCERGRSPDEAVAAAVLLLGGPRELEEMRAQYHGLTVAEVRTERPSGGEQAPQPSAHGNGAQGRDWTRLPEHQR